MEQIAPAQPGPPGFLYVPAFLRGDEQHALVRELERLRFDEIRMHGIAARRTAAHFGWLYGYDSARISEGPPVPEFLLPIRARAAAISGSAPEEAWAEVLVTHYPPGASIGWHRDAPPFGPEVIGISLGAPGTMRFRHGSAGRTSHSVLLEPGSLYVIGGEARTQWQHTLSPVKDTRYSITFRTLKRPQEATR